MRRMLPLLTACALLLLPLPVHAGEEEEAVITLPCAYSYPYSVGTVVIHFDREMPGTQFRLLRMQEEGNFEYFTYTSALPACPTSLVCETIEGDYLLEVTTPSDTQETRQVLNLHLTVADPDMDKSVTQTRIDCWFMQDPTLDELQIRTDEPVNNNGTVTSQTVCILARRSCAPGDLEMDGAVNAKDAAMLLRSAAAVGAKRASGLDSLRQAEADLDGSGSFNAVDASILLRYAALFGSRSFSGSIEDYLHR